MRYNKNRRYGIRISWIGVKGQFHFVPKTSRAGLAVLGSYRYTHSTSPVISMHHELLIRGKRLFRRGKPDLNAMLSLLNANKLLKLSAKEILSSGIERNVIVRTGVSVRECLSEL